MASTSRNVQSDSISAVSDLINSTRATVSNLHDQATEKFQTLAWTGETAAAFQRVTQDMNAIFNGITKTMDELTANVKATSASYVVANDRADDAVSALRVGLPGL